MTFAPIGPVVDRVIEKSVEFVPVIGPGLKYVKTAKKVTKFANPVKGWHATRNMWWEVCKIFCLMCCMGNNHHCWFSNRKSCVDCCRLRSWK